MKCTNCGDREAVYHYTKNVNGHVSETHLCQSCAQNLGFGFMQELGVNPLLGAIFGDTARPAQKACPSCGATMRDIQQTGRAGCPECYQVFAQEINPYIRRIHGSAAHTGRVPKGSGEEVLKKRKLTQLKAGLDAAVAIQDFEKAAALRDEIRDLEK